MRESSFLFPNAADGTNSEQGKKTRLGRNGWVCMGRMEGLGGPADEPMNKITDVEGKGKGKGKGKFTLLHPRKDLPVWV